MTSSTVKTLREAWEFPTGDSVTATPTVVDGVVYVGSWDDNFYAVDLATGKLRWKTRVKDQDGVKPYPGEAHRDLTSDGGLITSSAWFESAAGARPALVIFGGGYTLYALNATDGSVYWEHDYTGRPDRAPEPDVDGTRIFSSPVVDDGIVLFGVDVDGAAGYAGYLVGASLATGDPVWEYQTDANAEGQVLDDGCGSVWSSGTVLRALGLVVYGTADCNFRNGESMAESVLALRVRTGTLAWQYRPPLPDLQCDWDFGATANAGVDAVGNASFLGLGSKDGTYYSLDPGTGVLRWQTNVVFGGFSGGFIATTAYDGTARVRGHGHRRLRPLREQRVQADPLRPVEQARHAVAGAHRPCLRRRHRRRGVAGEPGGVVLAHDRGGGDDLRRPGPVGHGRAGALGPDGQAHRPGEAAPGQLVGDRHRRRRHRARAGVDLQPQGSRDRGPHAGRGPARGAVGSVTAAQLAARAADGRWRQKAGMSRGRRGSANR